MYLNTYYDDNAKLWAAAVRANPGDEEPFLLAHGADEAMALNILQDMAERRQNYELCAYIQDYAELPRERAVSRFWMLRCDDAYVLLMECHSALSQLLDEYPDWHDEWGDLLDRLHPYRDQEPDFDTRIT